MKTIPGRSIAKEVTFTPQSTGLPGSLGRGVVQVLGTSCALGAFGASLAIESRRMILILHGSIVVTRTPTCASSTRLHVATRRTPHKALRPDEGANANERFGHLPRCVVELG